jgi:predicted membrane-bound mannosyltransferase
MNDRGGEGELDPSVEKVDGVSIGMGPEDITLETLLDPSFPVYATAVVALSAIVRAFDEVSSSLFLCFFLFSLSTLFFPSPRIDR